MPTCSAKGCFNSSRKGLSMCYFPRNSYRRQKWLDNCRTLGAMHDWKPLESSALCENHFSKDSWEKAREDGKKKLKCTAIPTLFGNFVPQIKLSSKQKKNIVKKNQLITKDQNKSTISKCRQINNNCNENITPEMKILLKKCDPILKDLNEKATIQKSKNDEERIEKSSFKEKQDQYENTVPKIRIILKKCDPILKDLVGKSDLQKINDCKNFIPKEQVEEDQNKNFLNNNIENGMQFDKKPKENFINEKSSLCKKIHEDPDIARIISQPSPENKVDYPSALKNEKHYQSNKSEILLYTLKGNETEKSKNLSSPTRKLAVHNLFLSSIDKRTLEKIICVNEPISLENENDYKITCEDEEFFEEDLIQQEKKLSELQKFYRILEPGLHSEQRCGIMQRMYEKSLYLKRIIEAKFRKKERRMKNHIKKLKNDLFFTRLKSLGIYSNLHKNQKVFMNGKRKRVRQWSEKALNYAMKLKSSCGTKGYQELLNQQFLLPSLRTLRRLEKKN